VRDRAGLPRSARLDRVGEGGDVASPLRQGQGGSDPEGQAVRDCGEPMEIDPAAIRPGMTTRRVELAPERPDRQRRMTGERGVKPSDSEGCRFQPHITIGEPITHARLCSSSPQGADQGVRRVCPSRLPPDGLRLSIMKKLSIDIKCLAQYVKLK
jgi:hypothetical protein